MELLTQFVLQLAEELFWQNWKLSIVFHFQPYSGFRWVGTIITHVDEYKTLHRFPARRPYQYGIRFS